MTSIGYKIAKLKELEAVKKAAEFHNLPVSESSDPEPSPDIPDPPEVVL